MLRLTTKGLMGTDVAAKESSKEASELCEALWSVISFERVQGTNLTYDNARELVERLDKQNVAGLCIVTNEAAACVRTRE